MFRPGDWCWENETIRRVRQLPFHDRQARTPPASTPNSNVSEPATPTFTFSKPEEVALAETTLNLVLPNFQTRLTSVGDLKSEKVIKSIAADAWAAHRASEGLLATLTPERVEAVVKEVCAAFVERTIAIPQLVVTPVDQVSFGFKPFQLEGLGSWNYQPISRELLVQVLRTEKQRLISGEDGGDRPDRLEDYLVSRLIDFDEVDYDAHAEMLYVLSGQVVSRLRSYLSNEEDVRNVLQSRGKEMAQAIFAQMEKHRWRTDSKYRVTLHAPFTPLKPQAFDGSGANPYLDFRKPPERLSDIRRFIFIGFKKGCYPQAKFDSDTERQMAVLLERDETVELWMKPGPNQFKIYDTEGHAYQPDFVVETKTEKLILETKRRSDIGGSEVQRKSAAAKLWCHIATEHHAKPLNEKPWRYALIPDDAVQVNATLAGLMAAHTQEADMDLRSRFELETA